MLLSLPVQTLPGDVAALAPTHGPEHVYVLPASICDARCSFCPQFTLSDAGRRDLGGYLYEQGHLLPRDTFQRFIDALARLGGAERIYLAGGEPLLHRDLPEFSRHANEALGRRICSVFTSGIQLARRYREVLDAEPDVLSVSINGVDEETYSLMNLTARPGTHARLVEAMKAAGAYATSRRMDWLQLRFSVVLTRPIVRQTRALFDLALACGVRLLVFTPLFKVRLAHGFEYQHLALTPAEYDRFLDDLAFLREEGRARGLEVQHPGMTGPDGSVDTRGYFDLHPCVIGFLATTVTAEGHVRPCCASRLVLGNLHEEDFESIWRGERYRAFRRTGTRTPLGERPAESWCDECVHAEMNAAGRGLCGPDH
ncbi:MAG: radical SAM protein [Planctomycetes bacterium]|nr:radical SAM protein [Planctomycetota bacterium]